MDQMNDIDYGDDLEKCIDRNAYEDEDMEEVIQVQILKQILDHFMPKWRKHTDKHYKLKKFATEDQLDRNLSKIRNLIDERCKGLIAEIINIRENMDEFEAQAEEVKRIIKQDRIATERIRLRQKHEELERRKEP